MTAPSGWRMVSGEVQCLYSPAGFRLVDDFTGKPPMGRVRARLDLEVSAGVWQPTDIAAVVSTSSIVSYPGLGRRLHPAGTPKRHYRARLEAEHYRPEYSKIDDGKDFFAPPWDDDNPPAPITAGASDVYLLPACDYPYPTYVPVLHGMVVDAVGAPVANVLVHQAAVERTLTDERGAFSLPLRWATTGMKVDATDMRAARAGFHVLSLPIDLRKNLKITVV